MLLRPFTAYVAGVATVAIAYSAASDAPGTLGFGLGVLTTLLAVGWLLGSRSRAQQAGKFLLRASGPSEVAIRKAAAVTPKPVKPQSRVFVQTVSALKNMGSDRETARWAAGQATMRLPDGQFEDTFRLAVQIATGREAA